MWTASLTSWSARVIHIYKVSSGACYQLVERRQMILKSWAWHASRLAVAWLPRPPSRRELNIPFVLVHFWRLASTVKRKLRTIVSCGCALCKKLCLTGLIKGLIHGALMFADVVASENKTSRISFQICIHCSAVRIVECLCSNLFIAQTREGNWGILIRKCIEISLEARIPSSRTWNETREAIARNKSADDWQIVLHAILLLLFQDGGRGHLEGLASVYCEVLMAPFGEVLMLLEDARRKAWSNRSPKHSAGQGKGYRGSCNQIDTLPNSHSQPLYVPGKYSVREKSR